MAGLEQKQEEMKRRISAAFGPSPKKWELLATIHQLENNLIFESEHNRLSNIMLDLAFTKMTKDQIVEVALEATAQFRKTRESK